jgi:glycosyl transferase family 25
MASVHAYVINLARSPDRRAHILAELEKCKIEYEFVEGVDGRDLDLNDHQTIDPSVLTADWFRPGVAGCALSHLRVHQKIVADGRDQALVLEDDVTLPADLGRLLDSLADQLDGAEVALLNYDSKETCRMSREGSVSLPSSRLLVMPIDVGQPASAAAYVITREACERMEKSILPVRAKADDWGIFYRERVLDRVRCVVPLAVVKSPGFGSTMEYNSRGSIKGRLKAIAARYDIPLVHQLIAYRRQRIMRKWARAEVVDEPFIEKPSRLELSPISRT